LDSPHARRKLETVQAGDLSRLADQDDVVAVFIEPNLAVLGQPEMLKAWVSQDKNLILVLTEQCEQLGGQLDSFLQSLLDWSSLKIAVGQSAIAKASSARPAMIGWVDYRSSLFKPLADPRFNDFSKIRFWSRRTIQGEPLNSIEPLAKFEDGSPWLLRKQSGNGSIWLMASGWQTTESSFALSTKFIPLLLSMIDPKLVQEPQAFSVQVGQAYTIADNPQWQVSDGQDRVVAQQADSPNDQFLPGRPGLFSIKGNRWSSQLVVDVPMSESRLVSLDPSVLDQYGVNTGRLQSQVEIQQHQRQLKSEELERDQRLWKWLILIGIAVLVLETLVAGLTGRRKLEAFAASPVALDN
jgi:hypothetical protein